MDDEKPIPTESGLLETAVVEEETKVKTPEENSENLLKKVEQVVEEKTSTSSTSTSPQEEEGKVVESQEVVDKLSDSAVSAAAIKLKDKDKINILLKAVGDAPILKQKLWSVPADREVCQIIEFVKKYLKLDKHQSLFLFVNQSFAPSPDQPLRELYECFGSDGKIVLHYSTTYAWG